MRVSTFNELPVSRSMLRRFGGYCHRLYIGEEEFYDMGNLSSDCYPLLSPRRRRGSILTLEKANGLFAKQKLIWVNGSTLYYNGAPVGQVADSEKQFVSMGAYVLIFPDKKVLDTTTLTLKDMEAAFSTVGTTTYTLTKEDGTPYDTPTVSATAPEEPEDGALWMDSASTPHTLKQFSAYSAAWVPIATTYIRIGATGIGALFNEGDGIAISGSILEALNADCIVQRRGEDYLVVIGILDEAVSQSTALRVQRKVPDMEFLTEHNNRVWGCNSEKHEIYACKLGDPWNWNCFAGLSTDSYAVTVGSDGDFTGAASYLDYILFFKADRVHIVQGTKPANFQVMMQIMRGVEKGSEKSLAMVNEVLIYKSPEGICAYTGGQPVPLYEAFGNVRYQNAVAGAFRGKYYVSMQEEQGSRHLFVYDLARQLWHREDALHAKYFAKLGDELYYITDGGLIGTVAGSTKLYEGAAEEGARESEVEWFAETGEWGMDSPDQKYISRILLRMTAEPGSRVTVCVQYDSSGIWEQKRTLTAGTRRTFTIPLIPHRCDHMKLRISGTGSCKIFSISKEIEQGSELNGRF